ncbi:MAG: PH domain-containing protein [Anaerolineae bacterium]|nr:PH domain-containing protein [Anaerolineae bacterium]
MQQPPPPQEQYPQQPQQGYPQQGYPPAQPGYGGMYPPPGPERFIGEWRRSMATWGFWWRALLTFGLYVVLLWPKNEISVTTRRVSQRHGGILGGSETTIAMENITDVTIDISPLGSILDYGHVIIQSAGSSAAEIDFDGLARAKLLREVIFDLRDGQPDEAALKVMQQG